MLEDPGATNNFMTHKLAKKLWLPSKPLSLSIRVLEDRHRHKQTRVSMISQTYMQGRRHHIQAICMNSLTAVSRSPAVPELYKHFPETDQEPSKAFNRPHGKVQVMLGMPSRLLHCKDGQEAGIFFPAWVLTGCSPALRKDSPRVSAEIHSTTVQK